MDSRQIETPAGKLTVDVVPVTLCGQTFMARYRIPRKVFNLWLDWGRAASGKDGLDVIATMQLPGDVAESMLKALIVDPVPEELWAEVPPAEIDAALHELDLEGTRCFYEPSALKAMAPTQAASHAVPEIPTP